MKKCFKFAILTIMAVMPALTMSAYANGSDATSQKNPVWSVNCNNAINPERLTCKMTQTVFAANSKTRIFSAIISEEYNKPILLLALPHGLNLLQGVKMSVDEGEITKYPIQTADVNGAYAKIPLSKQMANRLKAGNILSLNVMASSNSPIELQLSLSGFSSTYALFRQF